MNFKLLLCYLILIFSCSAETKHRSNIDKEIDLFVDIRISNEDKIKFNGALISESSLYSHIQNLNVSENTKARIIFDENSSFGVVTKSQMLLHEQGITHIKAKILTEAEFLNYEKHVVHIDILNSDKILFNGNLIFIDDLDIALTNSKKLTGVEYIITPSNYASFGIIQDIQKLLVVNSHDNIAND